MEPSPPHPPSDPWIRGWSVLAPSFRLLLLDNPEAYAHSALVVLILGLQLRQVAEELLGSGRIYEVVRFLRYAPACRSI
jgi:hypothetical protein